MKRFITLLISLGLLFTTGNAIAADVVAPSSQTAPKVLIKTSLGSITVQLDPNTPMTTKNFLAYVNNGFYNGTLFHRVIPEFMIQGGGFSPGMIEKAALFSSIKNEANLGAENTRGTLAMARTSDPDSATAQFFINVKDNDFLNYTSATSSGWGYCVFGQVIEGMEIVDKIDAVSTMDRSGYQDVPQSDVIILSASVIN